MKLHLSCGLCRLCGNCRTCRTSIIAGKDKKGRKKKNSAGSTSTSSCLSTHEMSNIIEELKLHQHRDSTKRNYLAIWRVFNQFFVRLDYKPHEWTERLNLLCGIPHSEQQEISNGEELHFSHQSGPQYEQH